MIQTPDAPMQPPPSSSTSPQATQPIGMPLTREPDEPMPTLPGDDGQSRTFLCPICGQSVDKANLSATLYHQRPGHRRRDKLR